MNQSSLHQHIREMEHQQKGLYRHGIVGAGAGNSHGTSIIKGCVSDVYYMGCPSKLMRIMVSLFTENNKSRFLVPGGTEYRTLENPPR